MRQLEEDGSRWEGLAPSTKREASELAKKRGPYEVVFVGGIAIGVGKPTTIGQVTQYQMICNSILTRGNEKQSAADAKRDMQLIANHLNSDAIKAVDSILTSICGMLNDKHCNEAPESWLKTLEYIHDVCNGALAKAH